MEKNYYPLRQGSNSDTIVSDVPTRTYQNKEEVKADINHYGGHLVCESCPPSIAKQLIEAYNEKHGCTDKKNPCTGGRMCCQSKISHHTWMEQEEGKRSNPLKAFLLQSSDFKIKVMAPSWDQVAGLIQLLKLENNSTTKWEHGMTCDATIIIGYLRDELTPKIETAADNPNSAHSFTEGMDLGRTNSPDELLETKVPEDDSSIDDQIKFMNDILKLSRVNYTRIDGRIQASGQKSEDIPYSKHEKIYKSIINNLQAIKRFNNSPALHDVDVEKVIMDLLHFSHYAVKHMTQDHLVGYDFPALHDKLMNAEAALGMLQAFKKQREVPKTGSAHWDESIKDMENRVDTLSRKNQAQVRAQSEAIMRDTLVRKMLDINRYSIADAIIFAVKEIDKIKPS